VDDDLAMTIQKLCRNYHSLSNNQKNLCELVTTLTPRVDGTIPTGWSLGRNIVWCIFSWMANKIVLTPKSIIMGELCFWGCPLVFSANNQPCILDFT